MEGFSLNTFLLWLISGGATIAVRLVVARIPRWKENLSEGERSALSMLFSVILIAGAFFAAVYFEAVPRPETGDEWFKALFIPIGTALGLPAMMTTAMQVKKETLEKRDGFVRSASHSEADRLFGIRW